MYKNYLKTIENGSDEKLLNFIISGNKKERERE